MTPADQARVARLRAALVEPAALCAALGLAGHRIGRCGVTVRCLAHLPDNHPSAGVYLTTHGVRWHCHACGVGGDIIDVASRVAGIRPRGRAFWQLIKRLELIVAALPTAPFVEKSEGDTSHVAELLLAWAPLASQPDVSATVKRRGLEPYASRLAALPADQEGRARLLDAIRVTVTPAAWVGSGLGDGAGLCFPSHRLVIPWFGPDGLPNFFQRRAVCDSSLEPRYVNPPGAAPAWPYGIDLLVSAGGVASEVAFVEGALDALAAQELFRRHGAHRVALGLPSASGWRPEWATLAAGRVAIIAVDHDPAGDRLVERMHRDLLAAGATAVGREVPVHGKDWGEALVAA